MKLKNICLGIACIAVVSACNDKMDYHEYTSYDKDYVFSDFSRTAGFVNNIYSYLDSDLPSYQSLASACDEAEMAVTYSSVLDYTNGAWSALNPKSLWGYYSGIRAANYFLEESKDLDFYDLRYAQDYDIALPLLPQKSGCKTPLPLPDLVHTLQYVIFSCPFPPSGVTVSHTPFQ